MAIMWNQSDSLTCISSLYLLPGTGCSDTLRQVRTSANVAQWLPSSADYSPAIFARKAMICLRARMPFSLALVAKLWPRMERAT